MPIDPKRPAAKAPPPPASRRPATTAGAPMSERGPGFVWLLAPHPGRVRAMPLSAGGLLGRGEEASLRIDAPGVAPSHAKVELVGKGPGLPAEIYITDNGTPSGTYVSGMRASRTVLAEGDLLRVGAAIALVVERDVGSYDGAVIEEGGLVRGPRSRRGFFAAVERAMAEPREGRRAVVVAGLPGSGRRTIARRIAEAWAAPIYGEEGQPLAPEVELLSIRDEDVEAAVAAAAARGAVVVRGLERAPEPRRAALARALEKRRTVPVIALVDDPAWALPPDLDPLFGHRVDLPSLEQRREEIPSIVRHRFERRGVVGNRLSIELYEALTRAAWPGELAELVDCVDKIAASHASEPRLGPEHLVRPLSRRGGRVPAKAPTDDAQNEVDRIRAALVEAKGSVAAAARALHLSRQALYREAARLGIDIRRTREDGAA
ncbi:MAG: FHA domain-containing protein [Deltaproteobacteria bacterium]|nr:FHA domain-containing protein [Deltaproteobacteria bacterium]